MLGITKDTSAEFDGLETGSTHRYIVQPISYVEIADNVSPENSIGASCGVAPSEAVSVSAVYDNGSLTLSWQVRDGAETYYIYRYHPDADMLSTPKQVSGTSYTYRTAVGGMEYHYLITTEKLSSRKYYNGAGALSVLIRPHTIQKNSKNFIFVAQENTGKFINLYFKHIKN